MQQPSKHPHFMHGKHSNGGLPEQNSCTVSQDLPLKQFCIELTTESIHITDQHYDITHAEISFLTRILIKTL